MGYEVDFLAVGDGKRCGDAIAIRYGDLLSTPPTQKVVIIDGGYQENGEALVSHIRDYYGTDRADLVVLTHPDMDHASGLTVVLEKMRVGRLWMHLPWNHTTDISDMFKSEKVTDKSVSEALRRSLDDARSLEKLARSKGIPIEEPFASVEFDSGAIRVVGPTVEFYESLLPHFRSTPEPREGLGLLAGLAHKVSEVVRKAKESLSLETLKDGAQVSAENNTSAILLASLDGHLLLFTGDSGILALEQAIASLAAQGVDHSRLAMIQVPHHGSIHSVGPTVLNQLVGPILDSEEMRRQAYVSASKDGAPRHPAKKVCNAFKRRGAPVTSTQEGNKLLYFNAPSRNWPQSTPLPFYEEVDDLE
jgi:beta-lactamase superfamily II metal-dependent hydrolase